MAADEEVVILARLAGTREYMANAEKNVVANRRMAESTEMMGRSMEHTTKRSYLMNQALFTVRRVVYGLTLATIGAGVAALHMGYQYNSAMQTARVALTPVFRDTVSLNKELDYLFNFTKYTPFQFKDVTTAFRVMYFGLRSLHVSVADVNQLLHAMTDALAAVGKDSPGQLNRVSVALQHMAYLGHLTGQVVQQLNRDGLPFTAALKDQLHLTGQQIHDIGRLNISSAVAIQALTRYIESGASGMQGAAKRIATGSVHGLFTTFKDNVSQLMGYLENTPFLGAQNWLNRVNDDLGRLEQHIKQGRIHGVGGVLGDLFGPGAAIMWKQVAGDLHLLFHDVIAVVDALAKSQTLWTTLYGGLVLLHGILIVVNPLLHNFGLFLAFLIPTFITYKTVVFLATIQTKSFAFWEAVLWAETRKMTFWQFLAAIAVGRYTIAAKLAVLWTRLFTLAFIEWEMVGWTVAALLAVLKWRLATFLATTTLFGGPIVWLITGIALLVAGLVILYFKWQAFHDMVNRSARIFKTVVYDYYVLPWLELYRVMKWIVEKAKELVHTVEGIHLPGWLKTAMEVASAPLWAEGYVANRARKHLHFASGGTMPWSGPAWVGENGPELAWMPAGTRIFSNAESSQFRMPESWQSGGKRGPIVINLRIGNHQVEKWLVDIEEGSVARA